MGPTDVIVLIVVAALLVLAVRSVLRSSKSGCSGCGSASSCTAHASGAPCPAARDMLAHASKRLNSLDH